MNERFEKKLDERLKRVVDSGKVEFNSGQWKQKYPVEYEALVSRAGKRPSVLRFLAGRPLLKVAAVIAVTAIVIFFVTRRPEKHVEPVIVAKPAQSILRSPQKNGTATEDRSPAVMLSRISLMLAYERGGMEAVDEQCEKAFKLLGQKNTKVSLNELLIENNGKEPERENL